MQDMNGCGASLEGVSKRYGATPALEEVTLRIEPGAVTALLGPNGAGKSTAVALLLGLVRAQGGRVRVLGGEAGELAARRRTGVMLQSAALPDTLRVGELLRLVRGYYPNPLAAEETLELCGLGALRSRAYAALSGGEQRRVQFALAICGNPDLMFLDEPTTGLDVEARARLWSVVRALAARGCAILLTTHYLEEAEALASRVAVLVRGRIVSCGTVEQIRAHGARRRIRCISGLPVDEIRAWAGVSDATRTEGWLQIEGPSAEPIVRRLLAADPTLSELEVRRTGLAEAFVRITREAA
jgi:ABC-2 type transport system ATP-binding protein